MTVGRVLGHKIENRPDFEAEMANMEWECEESYGTSFESIGSVGA